MFTVELKNGRTIEINASQVKEMKEEISAFLLASHAQVGESADEPWILSAVYHCDRA